VVVREDELAARGRLQAKWLPRYCGAFSDQLAKSGSGFLVGSGGSPFPQSFTNL
jgi:hypothetical protein